MDLIPMTKDEALEKVDGFFINHIFKIKDEAPILMKLIWDFKEQIATMLCAYYNHNIHALNTIAEKVKTNSRLDALEKENRILNDNVAFLMKKYATGQQGQMDSAEVLLNEMLKGKGK
jgi:hypothetical protein